MRSKSILIVIILLMSMIAPMAAAIPVEGPSGKLRAVEAPVPVTIERTGPLTGPRAVAGPYGPSNLVPIFELEDLEGMMSHTYLDDFDGDGDKDYLYALGDGSGTWDLSLLDLGNFTHRWVNKTITLSTIVYSFTILDFDNDGIKDLMIRTDQKAHMVWGANGTEAWSLDMPPMLYGVGQADVDGDGTIEPIFGAASGVNTFYKAYNFSTGAIVWNSGPKLWAGSFMTGQLDGDAQEEIVYIVSDFVSPHYNITVVDPATNTTEWNKIYPNQLWEYRVKDMDTDGTDEVLTRMGPMPTTITLYEGEDGTQIWTNSSYSSPAFLNRIGDTDADDHLEIFSSDWGTEDVELIDGVTGFQQGYWTCSTYPPTNTWILPPYLDGSSDLAISGGHLNDRALRIVDGEDLSLVWEYKTPDIPFVYISDMDGDGFDEMMLRTSRWPDGGNVSIYNVTNFQLEWSLIDIGLSYGTMTPYIRGNQTAVGNKTLDIVFLTQPLSGQTQISFMDPVTYTFVNSTQTYESMAFWPTDIDDDGLHEVIFTEADTTAETVDLRVLKIDIGPTVNATLPAVQMTEDTPLPNAINLTDAFVDDGVSGSMTFEILSSGNDNITGTLNGTWLDLDIGVDNWNGDENMTVRGNDGVNTPVDAILKIQVAPVNDLPVIEDPGDLEFYEDQQVLFNMTASDVDNDTLEFSANISLVKIDPDTGQLNFTPTNNDVGAHSVLVSVSDGVGSPVDVAFNVTIRNTNDIPGIVGDEITQVYEDIEYNQTFDAFDDDGFDDVMTWALDTNATFLTIGNSTGGPMGYNAWIEGTPVNEDVGLFYVNISIEDPYDGSDFRNYTLTVINTNDEPEWVNVPENSTIVLGDNYSFDVNATDVDVGDHILYGISAVPGSVMTIGASTGIIDWTPEATGNYTITVTATDDISTTISHEFWVDVTEPPIPNDAPTATLVSPADGVEVSVLNPSFTWTVDDPDGDDVTSDLFVGKTRADVVAHTASSMVGDGLTVLSFKPTTLLEKGTTYYWTVIPSDGKGEGTCSQGVWSFTVNEDASMNTPPVIKTIGDQYAYVGDKFVLRIDASDQDNDVLFYSLDSPPAGMTIDSSTGEITWKPSKDQLGDHTMTVKVGDGKDITEATFTVTVEEAIIIEPPVGFLGSLLLLMLLIIIIIVVVIVLVVFAVMRKKDKGMPPQQGPPVPPPVLAQGTAAPVFPYEQGPGQTQEDPTPPAVDPGTGEEATTAAPPPPPPPPAQPEETTEAVTEGDQPTTQTEGDPPKTEGFYQPQPTEEYYQDKPTDKYYQDETTETYYRR